MAEGKLNGEAEAAATASRDAAGGEEGTDGVAQAELRKAAGRAMQERGDDGGAAAESGHPDEPTAAEAAVDAETK